jgi:hypothetical protein
MNTESILNFLRHSLLATLGSLFGGYLIGFLIALPFGFVSSGIGNIVDKTVDTWFFRHCVDSTFPLFPVLTALWLGLSIHRSSKSKSGPWVWILPAAILLWNVLPSMLRSPDARKLVYDDYFTRNCARTECLYQFFITNPFYTSAAYAIGCLAKRQIFH